MEALSAWLLHDPIRGAAALVAASALLASTAALLVATRLASRPALRHLVLLSALIACLVSPLLVASSRVLGWSTVSLNVSSPGAPIEALDDSARLPAVAEPLVIDSEEVLESSLGSARQLDLPPLAVTESRPSPNPPNIGSGEAPKAIEPRPQSPAIERPVAAPSASGLDPFAIVIAVWTCGVLVMAAICLRSCVQLRRIRRSLAPTRDITPALGLAAARLGVQRLPEVRSSDRASTPFVTGFFRPVIVLPAGIETSLEREALVDVLAHEAAHVMRRDQLVVWLQAIARCLYWPLPTIHLLNRELASAREEICDNHVLAKRDAVSYGETLLRVAQLARAARPTPAAMGILRWRGLLERRIAGLINERRGRATRTLASTSTATLGLFVAASVVVSGVSIVTADAPADEPLAAADVADSAASRSVLDGTTSPGASVELYSYASWNAEPVLESTTTADDAGRFSLDIASPDDRRSQRWLVMKKPGFASARKLLRNDDRTPVALPLRSETASLSGVITDNVGSPVIGALVTTQSSGQPIPGVHSATTDRDGRFSIDDLAPWNAEDTRTYDPKTQTGTIVSAIFYSVIHRDFPRTRGNYSRLPQQVELRLDPPAIVEGAVADLVTGEAVPHVEVQAQGIGDSGWYTVKTDDEGRYELRMVSDYYNIWAIAPDRMPLAIKALQVVQGERLTGKNIHLTRGGFIEGTVVDFADNQPVDGESARLRVAHYGPARPRTGAAVTSAQVGADGTYRLHVAPGRNYIYLMSGDAPAAYVEVGEGQTVTHKIERGRQPKPIREVDPDQRLGSEIRSEAHRKKNAPTKPPQTPDPATLRHNSTVGRMLTRLAEMNANQERFGDPWANQLRAIAALGEEAVPELVEELDRTDDRMMLSSLAFILRAIGDEAAVPGLIRAIPKTLQPPGSDMGLRIEGADEALVRFLQKHDLSDREGVNSYSFGRPVREVFGALQSITGEQFTEQEIYSISLGPGELSSQTHAKRLLNHRVAQQWANWWNDRVRESIDDKPNEIVAVPPPPVLDSETESLSRNLPLISGAGLGNAFLESARRTNHQRAMYDLDTGRMGTLPKRWRDHDLTGETLAEVTRWARAEGYDLMGDEIPSDDGGDSIFVLRPLGLQTWELPDDQWKASMPPTSIATLQAWGRANDGEFLLHTDPDTNKPAPRDVATFFYLTNEGTPGILYVGVQVHDNSYKSGKIDHYEGDNELNPKSFAKGRRFSLRSLRRPGIRKPS